MRDNIVIRKSRSVTTVDFSRWSKTTATSIYNISNNSGRYIKVNIKHNIILDSGLGFLIEQMLIPMAIHNAEETLQTCADRGLTIIPYSRNGVLGVEIVLRLRKNSDISEAAYLITYIADKFINVRTFYARNMLILKDVLRDIDDKSYAVKYRRHDMVNRYISRYFTSGVKSNYKFKYQYSEDELLDILNVVDDICSNNNLDNVTVEHHADIHDVHSNEIKVTDTILDRLSVLYDTEVNKRPKVELLESYPNRSVEISKPIFRYNACVLEYNRTVTSDLSRYFKCKYELMYHMVEFILLHNAFTKSPIDCVLSKYNHNKCTVDNYVLPAIHNADTTIRKSIVIFDTTLIRRDKYNYIRESIINACKIRLKNMNNITFAEHKRNINRDIESLYDVKTGPVNDYSRYRDVYMIIDCDILSDIELSDFKKVAYEVIENLSISFITQQGRE